MTRSIVFAVPGDIHMRTGGYLYDLNLMTALSGLGLQVQHMEWGGSFPDPTSRHAGEALENLQALGSDQPVLVDGLAYGALDPEGLQRVKAPLFALVHHSLALEPGLPPAVATVLAARERANLEIARHIFVTSPHTGSILSQHYCVAKDRISVVRPGFDRAPRLTLTKPDPPLIFAVGILAHRKGHDILLRALAKIDDLNWQADIVGRDHEPGMASSLTKMITELGLEDKVRLSGEVSQDDLHARYQQATIFALATRYEGYGMVFGEAMGHGLPIVSTCVGAVPETVGRMAGLLVAPEDPAAFAAALRRMLIEPDLRDSCVNASLRGASSLADWRQSAMIVRDVVM